MQIEVTVKSLDVRTQETKKGNTLHWQKVGYDAPENDWPVVFDFFLPKGNPLSLGKHSVHLALKTDQWGALVVDPFNTKALGKA